MFRCPPKNLSPFGAAFSRGECLERLKKIGVRLRGRTRTYYLRFRKPALYPDELRGVRAARYHEKFAKKSLYLSILFES